MSKLKCPFCQQELRSVIQQEGENTHTTWHCPKCELGKYKWACGNKTLWQALIDSMKEHDLCHDALVERTKELDRTRKALEFITRISGAGMSYQDMFIDAHEVAKFALGQVKYPILIGRYDKEMTDLLRGGDNE